MKRKFFPMMMAACAALFSFTGLTGCGGGGGSSAAGTMTYSDWASGTKEFVIWGAGAVWVKVSPIPNTVQGDPAAYGKNYDKVDKSVGLPVICNLDFSEGNDAQGCLVSYAITQSHYDAEGNEVPALANLIISLGSAAQTVDGDVLAAFGFKSEDVILTSSMTFQNLIFGSSGGTFNFAIQTDDQTPKPMVGRFVVQKQ